MSEKKPIAPALVLFFLAPVIAELLTSSSPPAEFFAPFGFVVMCALYGTGAVLAHELRVAWHGGWPTMLALGAAFAVIEEGLMVRSFFDPNWPDIAGLGSYGRALGVNWIWSLDLIVFHAVYSIAVPNLLVGLLFPSARERRWTGRPGFIILCALLAVDVVLGGYAITRYAPPLVPCVGAVLLAAGLVALGRVAPIGSGTPPRPASPSPRDSAPLPFLLAGLLGAAGYFVMSWVAPGTGLPPAATAALTVAEACSALLVIRGLIGRFSFSEANQWSLATGALLFFVALAPLAQMDGNRKDDTRGMAIVGLAMAAFLAAVLLLVLRRKGRGASGGGEPSGEGERRGR